MCEGLSGARRSVVEGDVKKEEMYGDHKKRLNEEGEAEVCTEPVEDSVSNIVRSFSFYEGCGEKGSRRNVL